jgi:hypothetical protein
MNDPVAGAKARRKLGAPSDTRDQVDIVAAVCELQSTTRSAGRAMNPDNLVFAASDVIAERIRGLLAAA